MSESQRHYQVVGVDGSPGSTHALAWAAARADTFGPVEPVAVWQYPWWSYVPTGVRTFRPPDEQQMVDVTGRILDDSLAQVDAAHTLEPVILHGLTGQALVSISSGASLLVVGSRGHGAVASGLVGSVSAYCAGHATVPVAVVPEETPVEDIFGSVAVGHDGSAHADRALAWAVDNTPVTSRILVVHASASDEQRDTKLLAAAEEAVQRVRSKPELADRRVEFQVRPGDARHELRSLAEECDMLVVAGRGHTGLPHLLLGSVSSALVHHPLTATVVVRD